MWPASEEFRKRLLHIMDTAEKIRGQPPNINEIFAVSLYVLHFTYSMFELECYIQNLYREDFFFTNNNFSCWSTSNTDKEGFEVFSDRFIRAYPGYCLDEVMRIRARPETRVLNMENLVSLFRSKDEALWNQNAWMFQNEFKFLDGAPNHWNKIALVSFPRSGNTFLRKVSELLTGI